MQRPMTKPGERPMAFVAALACLGLMAGTIYADESTAPALTPQERVERLTEPEICACWFYQPLDPAAHGPPQPPRTAWEDEPLEQVYATMIASLRLHPQLADLLRYFLVEEMTEEERAIVVPARVRPLFEEYLDRWVANLGSLQNGLFSETCDFLVGERDEGLFRYNAERKCRSVPRSITQIAFSLRTGALHYFRNLDRAWESPLQQEARRQQDALIELIVRLIEESPSVAALPDDARDAILGQGIDDGRRRMRAWFDDPFQFLVWEPMPPGEFDEFLNQTRRNFDELLERKLEQNHGLLRGIPAIEQVPEGVLHMAALQHRRTQARVPEVMGSTIMGRYISFENRRWNLNDERLFPLGAPNSIGTGSRVSSRWRYPEVETRATLLPRDGLIITMQHPGVRDDQVHRNPGEWTDRVRRIILPDPSSKADWCEARFTMNGSHFTDYQFFNHLDFLDGRRNPREPILAD